MSGQPFGNSGAAADPDGALRIAEEVVRLAEASGVTEAEALVVAGESPRAL